MAVVEYTLARSKRKTIGLYVLNGAVEVRAPLRASKKDIDSFVQSKANWIAEHLPQSTEQAERRKSFTLKYGDTVTYRGRGYPIIAKPGNRCGFDDTAFYVPENLTQEQVKVACIQIYRMLAKNTCTEKVLTFAKLMGVMPTAVKINSASTRWGSCSAKKSLNFSWRLVMADDDVIDLVVVHELAHTIEMNHSERFWRIVESMLPDYKERKTRLEELQRRLKLENWE